MQISHKSVSKPARGFTTVELLVVLGIILVISAIALPSMNRTWNSYRLSSAAGDVAGILKRTRFEAIRTNTVTRCLIQQQGNRWLLGVDLNNDGVIQAGEPQVLLTGNIQLLAAGIAPGPASMGYPAAVEPYPIPGFIAFDARGGVNFGAGAPAVHVLYLGFPNQGTYGYRAVTVLLIGSIQTWSSGQVGPWHSPTI